MTCFLAKRGSSGSLRPAQRWAGIGHRETRMSRTVWMWHAVRGAGKEERSREVKFGSD